MSCRFSHSGGKLNIQLKNIAQRCLTTSTDSGKIVCGDCCVPACIYIVAALVMPQMNRYLWVPFSISSCSLVRVVITSNNKCGGLLVFVDGHDILVIFRCLYVRFGPEFLVHSERTTIWRKQVRPNKRQTDMAT